MNQVKLSLDEQRHAIIPKGHKVHEKKWANLVWKRESNEPDFCWSILKIINILF